MMRFSIKLVHCSQHALKYGLWVAKPYIPKLHVSTEFIVDEITSQQKMRNWRTSSDLGGGETMHSKDLKSWVLFLAQVSSNPLGKSHQFTHLQSMVMSRTGTSISVVRLWGGDFKPLPIWNHLNSATLGWLVGFFIPFTSQYSKTSPLLRTPPGNFRFRDGEFCHRNAKPL